MTVKLVWATPDADKHIAYCARVSNPANQDSENIAGLLRYCMEHGHVSIFQMANVCLEIGSTRDITRQILRHWSMHFHELDAQEFSQRYQDVSALPEAPLRECRLQDVRNRQNSLEIDQADDGQRLLALRWERKQEAVHDAARAAYGWALAHGIAKEQARALLPEGLTTSRIYLNGNIRNWIMFLKQRLDLSTQKEHRLIAEDVLQVLREVSPVVCDAFFGEPDGQENVQLNSGLKRRME